MKRRLFSILTALALCLTLLPTAALAAEPTITNGLTISTFTAAQSWTTPGGGTVTFTPENGSTPATLTLDNATIGPGSDPYWAVWLKDLTQNLIIELKGTNTLTGGLRLANNSDNSVEIKSGDPSGTPVLNVTRSANSGAAFFTAGTLTVSGNVAVNVNSTRSAISVGSLTINSGSTVTATTTGGGSFGALSPSKSNSTVTVNGGTLNLSGGTSTIKNTFAVQSGGKVTVAPGTTLKFEDYTNGFAANHTQGKLTVDNSTFINNGTVSFTGTNAPTNGTDVGSLHLSSTGTGYVTSGGNNYSNSGTTLTKEASATLSYNSGGFTGLTNGYTWDNTNTLTLTNVIFQKLDLSDYTGGELNIVVSGSVVISSDLVPPSSTLALNISGSGIGATLSVGSMNVLPDNSAMMLENLTATFGNISSQGTSEKLTLKNAAITTGLVNWPDYNDSASAPTSGVKLEGSSTLTVNGSGSHNDFVAATIDLDNNSRIVLNNAGATNGRIITNPSSISDDSNDMASYKAYLPAGYHIGTYEYSSGSYAYTILEGSASGIAPLALTPSATPVLALNLTLQRRYTVTFDPNGGTFAGSTDNTSYRIASDSFTYPGDPTRDGYTFSGWLDTKGTSHSFTSSSSITQDLTLTAQWTPLSSPTSSGDSDPTYAIQIEDAEHGSVALSVKRKYAWAGDTVTLIATPERGYTLETLTVTDRNGRELDVTTKGDGKYTFKMPASNVTVKATFMEDNSMLNFFVDVTADSYYYDAVLWAAENGITGGVDENHFGPDRSCTRAQAVTFLYRAALALGLDVSVGEDTNILSYNDAFDIPEYAIPAFQWAVGTGIVQGNNGYLNPNSGCTRAQIVTFLFRFAAANGMDFVTLQELVSGYGDADSVPGYALPAFNWALAGGIIQGNNGDLLPNQPCTRAQIVTMLYRLLGE